MFGASRFGFLNAEHDLGSDGWDDPTLDKLWRYNLHYFDDLNAAGAPSRVEWHQAMLARWVRDTRPGVGTGWEPYPTSLRIVNWIKWQLAGNPLPAGVLDSLAAQTRWLAARLEKHLLGNHLFANAKALVFAGSFFDGPEANAWLATGLEILERQIPEQILADGGQFERSPMYHALALEDMLDLRNVVTVYSAAIPLPLKSRVALWWVRIEAMRRWLRAMCHPDGGIGFFNDAAEGIAPALAELEAYARRLGFPENLEPFGSVTDLASSGYIRVERPNVVALLDVGPIGPDYLPAHAHADSLTFELSLFCQRVFVNSGTSCYGDSAERLRQRGTAAHNTVVVNGENSSEVWAGFRVGRRAGPVGLAIQRGEPVVIRCAHAGYGHLAHRLTHTRIWKFAGNSLLLEDRLDGRFETAQARFHLHPSIRATVHRGGAGTHDVVTLALASGQAASMAIVSGIVRTERATWHPAFGSSHATTCIVVDFTSPVVQVELAWNDAA